MAQDEPGDKKEDSAGESREVDSMLDTSETSRATQKVELDLDDAPFLEEEEEVKEEPQAPREAVSLDPGEAQTEPPKRDKKKLIIIGVAALLLLIVVAVAIKFFLFSAKTKPAADPTEQAGQQTNASEEAPPEAPELQYRMEPFMVEQKFGDDQIRFLNLRLLLGTKDPSVISDFESKTLPARNAIFYYLKNKDVQFLSDENNVEKMRSELLLVVNQYVSDGKFDTLLFEEYVVK
jgi:Flagellar basal body-associated protein